MVDYQAVHAPDMDATFYEAIFWDTKTAKSRFYKYNNEKKGFDLYKDKVQLPVPDIARNNSDIHINYQAQYITHLQSSFYEVLFYDTKTGKSEMYYFKGGDVGRFVGYTDETLPSKPLN